MGGRESGWGGAGEDGGGRVVLGWAADRKDELHLRVCMCARARERDREGEEGGRERGREGERVNECV